MNSIDSKIPRRTPCGDHVHDCPQLAEILEAFREENARLKAERDSLACEVAALRSGRAVEAALAAVALRTRERDEAREKLARCVEALEYLRKANEPHNCPNHWCEVCFIEDALAAAAKGE